MTAPETEHTPGLLSADWAMVGYGREARRMETIGAENFGTIALAYEPADARRIIACWNACAGLSTEALESGALQYALTLAGDLAARTPGIEPKATALYNAIAVLEGK